MRTATLVGACLLATAAAATMTACSPKGSEPSSSSAPTVSSAPAVSSTPAASSGPITLVIKDHRFTPAEIAVPANVAVELQVTNQDSLAEEFDSSALKVEKVIAGGDTGTIRLHPLAPGRYPFMGEYHSETAKGVVVSK